MAAQHLTRPSGKDKPFSLDHLNGQGIGSQGVADAAGHGTGVERCDIKRCNRCGIVKPLAEYHNSIASPDGKYSQCKPCVREKNRKWRDANKDTVTRMKKSYALYNAEKIRAKAKEMRKGEQYQAHMADYRRKWSLAKRYGITIDDYERLYKACGGKCEICLHELNCDFKSKHMACIDHDHATGKVRGILCRKCNQALGTFGDSVEGLKTAIAYLEKERGTNGRAGKPEDF